MHLTKSAIFVVFLFLISGCAYVPKVDEDQGFSNECDLLTRKLDLDIASLSISECVEDNDLVPCLIMDGILIPVFSFIASGSIVVAANTIHWLEYQGRCDEEKIMEASERMKANIES